MLVLLTYFLLFLLQPGVCISLVLHLHVGAGALQGLVVLVGHHDLIVVARSR